MDTTRWLIREIVKSNTESIERAREFSKWVIAGNAAMAGLLFANSDGVLALIGKIYMASGMTCLAISIACGFLAVIATNAAQGMRMAMENTERLLSSEGWKIQRDKIPFEQARFTTEYSSLFWGPLNWLTKPKPPSSTPIELLQPRMIGKALSAYVMFSLLQSAFSFLAIFILVIGIWK